MALRRPPSGFSVLFVILFVSLFVLPGVLVVAVFVAPLVALLLPIMLLWAVLQGAAGSRWPEHLSTPRHESHPGVPRDELEPAHGHGRA